MKIQYLDNIPIRTGLNFAGFYRIAFSYTWALDSLSDNGYLIVNVHFLYYYILNYLLCYLPLKVLKNINNLITLENTSQNKFYFQTVHYNFMMHFQNLKRQILAFLVVYF